VPSSREVLSSAGFEGGERPGRGSPNGDKHRPEKNELRGHLFGHPFPAPLWPPPSALSTVSRRVSRVFDISPRLSCPVRIWPLKESNAGQCNWSPRSFSGQSIARIVRVTSPACRGAHVSDGTPTMQCSPQILRQTFGHRCCPQLRHPTLWAVKRVVYWGEFQP
jgi:hypothetical protein